MTEAMRPYQHLFHLGIYMEMVSKSSLVFKYIFHLKTTKFNKKPQNLLPTVSFFCKWSEEHMYNNVLLGRMDEVTEFKVLEENC